MAEEDIVFGKNRHLFGGIEPSNMKGLSVMQEIVNGQVQVRIMYELPDDTTITGQTLCTVAGAVIRRQLDERPIDEFDGELVGIVTGAGSIVDETAEVDNIYYYQAFPYTTQGVYNRNPLNAIRADITPAATPGDMAAFSITPMNVSDTGKPRNHIAWTAPDDTEGESGVTVAGVMVRRKVGSYPVDWNDGDLISNDTLTVGGVRYRDYYDLNVEGGETYYYQAFPYSDQGVYNTNAVNRVEVTTEPDRPASLGGIKTSVAWDDSIQKYKASITVDFYNSAANANTGLMYKAEIRRASGNVGSTSLTPTTGGKVGEIVNPSYGSNVSAWRGPIYDSNISANTTYTYFAYAVSEDGVYGEVSSVVRTSTKVNPVWHFAYVLDISNADPATRVTYPTDCDNKSYGKCSMNSSGTFSKGTGWSSVLTPGSYFMPRPCMLKQNGTVDYYLYPSNYKYKADMINLSDVTNPDYQGNAMLEWPKIYTKRTMISTTKYRFDCSNVKYDSGYDCLCNYDKNDVEIDHFYTSIYLTAGSAEPQTAARGRSLSGMRWYYGGGNDYNFASGSSQTTKSFHQLLADVNGADYTTLQLSDLLLLQDLTVLIGKTTKTMDVIGTNPFSPSYSSEYVTGSADIDGPFANKIGNNSQNKNIRLNKLFGMEGLFNVIYMKIPITGAMTKYVSSNNATEVLLKCTPGIRDGSTTRGFNVNGTGYKSYGTVSANGISLDVNYGTSYLNYAMSVLPYGRLVTGASGSPSSTTYECDQRIHSDSRDSQVFYLCLVSTTDRSSGVYQHMWSTGGSVTTFLSCKPTKT